MAISVIFFMFENMMGYTAKIEILINRNGINSGA